MKANLKIIMRDVRRTGTQGAIVSIAYALVFLLSLTSGASASMLLSEEGISPTRSAEYVRTQSRNASTEADAVNYNPAGLPFMQNGGIYLMVNSVNSFTRKSDTVNMWGTQGVNQFNRLILPMQSQYQSANVYISSLMVPMPSNLSFIFKRDNWAVFSDVSILHGMPAATFVQGASSLDRLLIVYNSILASRFAQQLVGALDNSSMKRQELHIGATIGGSYAFFDWFSMSLSFRYINIKANTRVSQTPLAVAVTGGVSVNGYQSPTYINTDVSGNGMGIILGLDFRPLENLIIGSRLEYYPPMVLDKITNTFLTNAVFAQSGQLNVFCDSIWPLVINDRLNIGGVGNVFNILIMDPRTRKNIGNKVKATYPTSLSLGLSYRVIPALKLDTSADLTFPRARDLDGREKNWKPVGYRLGQGIEWSVVPWAAVSVGYSYNDFGLRIDRMTEYDDLLSSHTIGAGCSLRPWDFLTVTVAGSYSFYTTVDNAYSSLVESTLMGSQFLFYQGWNQKFLRDGWSVSVGVTFSFYPVAAAMRKKGEEHYWKGMSNFLSNDVDAAVDEFKSAQRYNPYFRDVRKKIKDMEELQKVVKKNIQQDREEKLEREKKEKGVHGYEVE
ncbi:MAG TPA: hypothetical protein P5115_20150 [Spirochaetota bacterium]|nr:hypothetical protein [Spirochaetota bacterium]